MNREEFLRMLARGVREGWISEERAGQLVDRFDAGEVDSEKLPLPPAEVTTANVGRTAGIGAEALRNLSRAERERLREELQDAFYSRVTRATGTFTESGDIKAWQRAMKEAIEEHVVTQATAGSGQPLTATQQRRVARQIERELGFLNRYADQVAIREVDPEQTAMSAGQMTHRSKQYAGSGRAAWYREKEAAEDGDGYVEDYIAVDDDHTCTPCDEAQRNSPYLPAMGPMPGEVCEGHGLCRCERVRRYAPGMVSELRRGAAA